MLLAVLSASFRRRLRAVDGGLLGDGVQFILTGFDSRNDRRDLRLAPWRDIRIVIIDRDRQDILEVAAERRRMGAIDILVGERRVVLHGRSGHQQFHRLAGACQQGGLAGQHFHFVLQDGFRSLRAGDADEQKQAADGKILVLDAFPVEGVRVARRDELRIVVQKRLGVCVPSSYVGDSNVFHYMFLATLM